MISKVGFRLIPFLFILYIVAYLDRVNIGFAQLQMKGDLGFSDAVYGLGAGIFFIGYFIFEIPSNLILKKVGARIWIARIMIFWGVLATAMSLVRDPWSFYILRFLLGAGEAGFFPGLILYLTEWFPAAERARSISLFMTVTALAGVVGGPISGALLGLHGLHGMAGWQVLFILEGIPAVVLGVAVLLYLTDRPGDAAWLRPEEKAWLQERLSSEGETRERQHHLKSLSQALLNLRIWSFCLVYFMVVLAFYGLGMWLPIMIKGFSGLDDFHVGLVSAVPYLAAVAAMVIIGMHSDRTGERRWHVALPAFIGAVSLSFSTLTSDPMPIIIALSLAAAGIWGLLGPFWALPTRLLTGTAAAGGIALINSIGNLGGFLGPYTMGLAKEATGSFHLGLIVLALGLVIGGCVVLLDRPDGDTV